MNKLKSVLAMLAIVMLAISCQKVNDTPQTKYLDVTPNNVSGMWKLVEWNGQPLAGGTYCYIEFTRKDKTFTIWQNFDSISNNAHQTTGTYNIQTDVELGAVMIGMYDYDGGFWAHDYEVNDLTATSMCWVAVDDKEFTQKYVRVDSIPVK